MNEKKIINEYLGIPYKHLGRSLKGFDCWGFVVHIYKNYLGIKVFDLVEEVKYDKNWSYENKDYITEYRDENVWKEVNKPRFLDIMLFNNYKKIPNHAGIYLSKNKFIHAVEKVGIVVSKLEEQWIRRLKGFYRYDSGKILS
jgi:cell wall-associated NlpC family hydrolase